MAKSRVIDVLKRLVWRPEVLSGATEAALFRMIEDESPTLLIDEVDKRWPQDPGDGGRRSARRLGRWATGDRPGASIRRRIVAEGDTR